MATVASPSAEFRLSPIPVVKEVPVPLKEPPTRFSEVIIAEKKQTASGLANSLTRLTTQHPQVDLEPEHKLLTRLTDELRQLTAATKEKLQHSLIRVNLIKRMQRALYRIKVGREVLRAEKQRDFTDEEVRLMREQEAASGLLVSPEETTEFAAFARERFERIFGPATPEMEKILRADRIFIFRRDEQRNHLMEFKDRLRGIDRIPAPSEDIRRENILSRHDGTMGTIIRGITTLQEVDERRIPTLVEHVKENLRVRGFSDSGITDKLIRRQIYASVLVHEWTHAHDKFFDKIWNREFSEPVTYLLEYRAMTVGLSPEEMIVADTIHSDYFKWGGESVEQMKQDPWFLQQIGGIGRVAQIMKTGKASMKERQFFLGSSLRNMFRKS